MKKIRFRVRTGLLLITLIFAVLGGNFLYTGAESASPLDTIEAGIPLNENGVPVQNFSPAYPNVTGISLVLKAPALQASDPSDIQSHASDAPIRMTTASGELTIVLSECSSGTQICSHTVSLDGVPDGWYLDIPVNCRLDTNGQYELSVSARNYQEGMNPSIYLLPQSAQIPEAAREADLSAAMRLTYDVLVPARLIIFLAVLATILLCAAATIFFSRKKTTEKTQDITLGKFLTVRIRQIPLIHILFFAAVTITAVMIRIAFLPVRSNDYYLCFESWISDMRSSGVWDALSQNIGDYPPLYMTSLTLLSLLPFEPVIIVKLMPCLFDFILALICVKLSGQLGVTALYKKLTLYAVILLNPLTILDSAAWGQCDSLYSSMILLTLLAACAAKLYSTEPPVKGKAAFWKSGDGICLLFAVAVSFKLQAVFFLPVLCLLWIMQKRNVLKPVHLLWVPIVYTISCIPMYLAGRSLKIMFKIYLGQANRNYGTLTLNYPNLYTLIGTWSETLYDGYFIYGMLLTFLLLIILFYHLYCRKVKLDSLMLCKVTVLSLLIICFCLPLVHERYAYAAEMLLFVIMAKESKHAKTALATMLCTLFTYCTYLMQLEQNFSVLPEQIIALVRLGVIFYLTGDIFQQKKKE